MKKKDYKLIFFILIFYFLLYDLFIITTKDYSLKQKIIIDVIGFWILFYLYTYLLLCIKDYLTRDEIIKSKSLKIFKNNLEKLSKILFINNIIDSIIFFILVSLFVISFLIIKSIYIFFDNSIFSNYSFSTIGLLITTYLYVLRKILNANNLIIKIPITFFKLDLRFLIFLFIVITIYFFNLENSSLIKSESEDLTNSASLEEEKKKNIDDVIESRRIKFGFIR